jgi:hypothetical protein
MTLGAHLSVTFEEFASILKIPIDDSLDRIHSMSDINESMNASALKPLHLNGVYIRYPHSTSTLQPLCFFMFKIITKVLVPKIGDRDNVRSYDIDLLVRMHTHGNVRFDLADFLFNQIRLASFEQVGAFLMLHLSKPSLMIGLSVVRSTRMRSTTCGLPKHPSPMR